MKGRIILDVDDDEWELPVEWDVEGPEREVKELLDHIGTLLEDGVEMGRLDEAKVWKSWKPNPRYESPNTTIEIAGHDIALGDELHRTTTDEKMVVLQFEGDGGLIYYSTRYGYGFYAEEFLAEDFDGVGYDGEPQIELVKQDDES